MNYRMIRYISGIALMLESAFCAAPMIIALVYHEREGFVYLLFCGICLAAGLLLRFRKPADMELHARDGFVTVAVCWLLLSAFGALPFFITREIPSYIDALFETVSGFTTTGASILTDVEALSHASLFWRSFTHWLGGMGVLVFILALLPTGSGSVMTLMKAESPGPSVSKFVPKVRETAKILYQIYIFLTAGLLVALIIAGMHWFDAVCLAMGAAGTGGFAVLNSSCASYTPLQQWLLTGGMLMFGVNFNFYFFIKAKKPRQAFRMTEVAAYGAVALAATAAVTLSVSGLRPDLHSLRDAAFQVSSIMTTTGYSSADFDKWPELSKMILVLLMFTGACAGSTGGGIKISRILIMAKSITKELRSVIHPRGVRRIRLDGKPVADETVRSTLVFLTAYMLIFAVSLLIVSADGFSFATSFTSVAATINNIGPGLDAVGPAMNYSSYSVLSKLVLIFDMLAGRLELFPMLVLCWPGTWKRS